MPEGSWDINLIQMPCSVIVYQASFAGVTYAVAAQRTPTGWTILQQLPLTGPNATTVINTGLAALTVGRTWKEVVVVIGNYSGLGTINVYGYTLLVIQGRWTLENNHAGSFIVNAAGVAGNVWIEICGGIIDGNQGNQVSGGCSIFFRMSDDCWVHHSEIIAPFRTSASAEGVYEGTCVQFAGNGAGGAGSYRGIVAHCRIRQMYKDGVQFERAPDGLVIGCTFLTTVSGSWETAGVQFCYAAHNGICIGCHVEVGGLNFTKGLKNHGCSDIIFGYNYVHNAKVAGIWLNSSDYIVSNCIVLGNRVVGQGGATGLGITVEGPSGGTNNSIIGNTITFASVYINIDASASAMYMTKIFNNTISGQKLGIGNVERGIYLNAAQYTQVQNNYIENIGDTADTSKAAIYAYGNAGFTVCRGNTIRNCNFPLRTSGTANYCVWTDNYAYYSIVEASTFFNMNGGTYHIVARNTAIGFQSYGITLDTNINYVWIYNNDLLNMAGPTLCRFTAGTNIYVYYNNGWTTENVLLSGTFAIDAIGVKTVTVNHSLGDAAHAYQPYTPLKQDFTVTVVQNTAVTDWAFNLLEVTAVSTTQVTVKINVSTASATVGAVANLGIHVTTGQPNRAGGL